MSAPSYIIAPNTPDSHQAVPNYVITFIPFVYRELYYSAKKLNLKLDNALEVQKPLVVVSDAIMIRINGHKGSALVEAEIELFSFNVNYSSKISVGDYVFINLMHDVETFERVVKAASNVAPINGFNDGLKFMGRVISVRQSLTVDPSTQRQSYRYNIHCASFTELMTQVYYNEFLSPVEQGSPNPTLQFFASVTEQYIDLFAKMQTNARISNEDMVSFFLDVFVGPGLVDVANKASAKLKATPNAAFLIPPIIRRYLGLPLIKNQKAISYQYADILHRVFGIQTYSKSFFPDIKQQVNATYVKCHPLHGGMRPGAANFNGIPLWDLLIRHANTALNELYTALRPYKNNKIVPQIILRQIPMTTQYLRGQYKPGEVTFFDNLPRWIISDKYPIFQYNLGISDAERFNFFMTFSDVIDHQGNPADALKLQIANKNWVLDSYNAARSGTKIHITHTNTDAFIQQDGTAQPANINKWATIIGDFYLNGHLKMNGSIMLAGIQEPIYHGDNLVFDGKIFHIEGFSHQFQVEPRTGKKSFITVLHLSHGYYMAGDKLVYMHDQSYSPNSQPDQLLPNRTGEEVRGGGQINATTFGSNENSDTVKKRSKKDIKNIKFKKKM